MNKRLLSKLEQGEGTTLMGKLFLTRRQRQVILKWFLFSLVYLVLQVMQDVLFSRIQIWGGCPDLVPGYLLLVCLMQGPGSGGLFALLAGVFLSLSGTGVSAGDHLRRCAAVRIPGRVFAAAVLVCDAVRLGWYFPAPGAAVCPGSVSGKYICRALAWRLGRQPGDRTGLLRPISPGVGPGENRR